VELRTSLNAAIERLRNKHVPSPRLNAELLLMFTVGCDRAYLYAHPERELTADEMMRYDEALARRATGVPAQYITGHQEFWGLDLVVSPAVLIPRPETEHLVEAVLEKFKMERRSLSTIHTAHMSKLCIIDIGTGSGAIALALAKEIPEAEIHAADISTAALEVAKANVARHELGSRVKFHQVDLLEGFPSASFDFVVSNPPYVGECEEDLVQLEVRKFEPRNAVFAGRTGMEVIERLIPQAKAALKPGGWLVFEISGTIAETVRRNLSDWTDVEFNNDLQGIPRVAMARKPLIGFTSYDNFNQL
jgi:release factor glutamine methyltransferase